MSLRTKLLFAVLGPVSLIVIISSWKARELFWEDRLSWLKESSDQQAMALARLFDAKVSQFKVILRQTAVEAEQKKPANVAAQPFRATFHLEDMGPFEAVSLVAPTSTGAWKPQWLARLKSAALKNWPPSYFQSFFGKMPFASLKDRSESSFWLRLGHPQGDNFYAMILPAQLSEAQPTLNAGDGDIPEGPLRTVFVVGFLRGDFLHDVIQPYRGSFREVMVLDDQGYALSHGRLQYVGALMTEHPFVKALRDTSMATRISNGTLSENLTGQQVFGYATRLADTNLSIAMATPLSLLVKGEQKIVQQLITIGVGILLIALAIGLFFGRRIKERIEAIHRALILWSREGKKINLPTGSHDELGQLAQSMNHLPLAGHGAHSVEPRQLEEVKKEAYRQLSTGLAKQLLPATLNILGHLQILRGRVTQENALHEITAIEKAARRVKEGLDHLKKISGSVEIEKEVLDLGELILACLKQLQIEIEQAQVQVVKNFDKAAVTVHGNSNQLQLAMTSLIHFCLNSMKESSTRRLEISVYQQKDSSVLEITDSGQGLSPVEVLKVFDPFSYEVSAEQGLGMAVAHEIISRHQGRIEVNSRLGEGSRFTIEWPVVGLSESQNSESEAASHEDEVPKIAKAASPMQVPSESDKIAAGPNFDEAKKGNASQDTEFSHFAQDSRSRSAEGDLPVSIEVGNSEVNLSKKGSAVSFGEGDEEYFDESEWENNEAESLDEFSARSLEETATEMSRKKESVDDYKAKSGLSEASDRPSDPHEQVTVGSGELALGFGEEDDPSLEDGSDPRASHEDQSKLSKQAGEAAEQKLVDMDVWWEKQSAASKSDTEYLSELDQLIANLGPFPKKGDSFDPKERKFKKNIDIDNSTS